MIDWSHFCGFFSTGIPPVVLYTSLIITAVLLIVVLKWKRMNKKNYFVLWALLAEYAFIVLCSTLICREKMYFAFERLELTPFWTYYSVIHHTFGVSVWDIILNVVLFIPLGLLLKLLRPSLSLPMLMLMGFCCSLFIETNQYIFEKGLAQFDDIMHNVIGAMIGWGIVRFNSLSKLKS